jgi:A/G-specific adenine glycosylase
MTLKLILLRKTTAKQVNDIYEIFYRNFPTPNSLARASRDKIRSIIRPLGLQNQRAKLLRELSVRLVELEEVPTDEKGLSSLPGVGQYSADAVRCLAFGEDVPMVDRNVVRVIDRVFSILPPGENKLNEKNVGITRDFIRTFLPKGSSRTFNLALLDFAAIVCKAKNPKCAYCSLNDLCNWYHKFRVTL